VNDLSQELLELFGVDEGAVLDEDMAQAAYLLRATVQTLDAALEFHNAAHKQMHAADADRPATAAQPARRWNDSPTKAHGARNFRAAQRTAEL
jgi:hypothetical protein